MSLTLHQGGDPFEVEITGPKGEKLKAPVKDNGDGTYRVDYTPLNGGPTKIAVTLRDKPVARSPYLINVRLIRISLLEQWAFSD